MGSNSDGNALGRIKKLIRSILLVLGGIFALLLILVVFLYGKSADFLEENQEIFVSFTGTLSEEWDPEDVYSMLSNDFISTLGTPNSDAFFDYMKNFGELVQTSDFEMQNYLSGTDGITAVVTYKAIFENVSALVTLTVLQNDGKILIQAFRVDPVGTVPIIESTEYEA